MEADGTRVRRRSNALLYLRGVMIFLALLVPLLSLLPLGWLWLWQNGYALYWMGGAFAFAFCAFLVQTLALRRSVAQTGEALTDSADDAVMPGDPGWTEREQAAWVAVEALAADVKPAGLTDRDKVLNLGLRTVEAVARQIHPQDRNPLWKFTVPEALALIERVSADLRPFVADNIPLGDQFTVGQLLKIYQWRSAVGMAEKAYDIWRLIRLINPVTAAAQEAREQITRHLYATVRDQLAKRLAQGYVREVGRAAIDLYGGRLKVSPAELEGHISASTLRDRSAGRPLAEPLRVLVAGQAGSGKSSLVNALSSELGAIVDVLPSTRKFEAHEVEIGELASALVIDSPGIGATAKEHRRFAVKAGEADLIVWAIPATNASDVIDRDAIADIRKHFADRPNRRLPPVLGVLTHIDALAPGEAWEPPYDPGPASPGSDRGRLIGRTLEAAAGNLSLAPDDVVPVSLAAGQPAYNMPQVLERIGALVPEARRAQLLRLMEDATPGWSARRLGRQATNVLASTARAVTPSMLTRWTKRNKRS
jgi:uncharacterized protein